MIQKQALQKVWSARALRGGGDNVYLPEPAIIQDIIVENDLVKTFVLAFEDVLTAQDFDYRPGQFMMVSAPHLGEAPISFSSGPSEPETFSLTIRKAGRLTDTLHELSVGDVIGVRGPYGRPFPLDELQGSNLLFVAGGIGLAPLRSAITHALANRDGYGKITVLYGSKHPAELCFVDDLARWREQGVECTVTVDEADDTWRGKVGLVTGLLDDVEPLGADWAALVCGPSIMIRFVLARLQDMGMKDDRLITTLERHMKCGVGICNHCYLDGRLVCADGPVFYRSELSGPEAL